MDNNETKTLLNKLSPSFCAAKWYNATIWLGSGMTTSCHHPPAHKIDLDAVKKNPAALHNTPEKKSQRQQMQIGERPKGCEYCWKLEDAGSDSDRVYKSKIYNATDLLYAYETPWCQDVNLKTLEISFDRTCNFACSYCNPAFSTTWAKDINTNGPYTNLSTDGRNHYTHPHEGSQLYKFGEANPYVEAFFLWWDSDLHRTLDELRITGGEPLMSAETWRLVDWYKNNKGKSKTRLAINTNLCAKPELVDKLIQLSHDVEALDVYTSAEAIGHRAEYIRDGMNWTQWKDNMHRLAKEAKLRGLHVMATPSVLSIMEITQFLDWCVYFKRIYGKESLTFTLNILRFPSFQSITVLPEGMRYQAARYLERWLEENKDDQLLHEMEKDHVTRLANYLRTVAQAHNGASPTDKLKVDLTQFLKQYDKRRGKDIKLSCPEIAEWLNLDER
jgi:pyruvate-formate lyase-activating enzyme